MIQKNFLIPLSKIPNILIKSLGIYGYENDRCY